MSDIIFECPNCEKSLKVDASAVGMQLECPECGQEIEIQAGQSDGEDIAEAHQEDVSEEPTLEKPPQLPDPQLSEPPPQQESKSMSPAQFRQLLENTSQSIIPQLEAASAEVRRALE